LLDHLPKSNALEKRLFEYICLIQFVIMTYLMSRALLNFGWTALALMDLVVALIGLLFYLLSKYKGYFNLLRIPLIGFLFAASVFFWYRLGGFYGTTATAGISVGLVAIVISPARKKIFFFLFSATFIITLVIVQLQTNWIDSTIDKSVFPINYIIFSMAILIITYMVKSEFDKERRKAVKQNIRLQALNEKLVETISQKEQYINELGQTRDRLIESEKMASIGRLTAGLAHELNNPLNYIGGNVQPIIQDLEDIKQAMTYRQLAQTQQTFTEIHNLLFNIIEGSQRASDVIDNLLKISPKAVENQVAKISLNELVGRTCVLLQNAHPEIHFWIARNEKLVILGNPTEINQVLLNLLKNAIDAVQDCKKGKIIVEVYWENDQSIVNIKDNGSGIPSANLSKIFEPFFTTKEEGKGTGLGLYISHGIIKKHGGKIEYSALDPGTCFKVSFPSFQES